MALLQIALMLVGMWSFIIFGVHAISHFAWWKLIASLSGLLLCLGTIWISYWSERRADKRQARSTHLSTNDQE